MRKEGRGKGKYGAIAVTRRGRNGKEYLEEAPNEICPRAPRAA